MFTQNLNINVHRSFTHSGQKLHTNCGCVLRHVSRVWLFATPWTIFHQAPLSMGFSRQEYWRGSPCPPPGDLPDPGIEPTFLMSPALAVTRTWYNLHKFNLYWVPESDAACIFWPRSSHLSFHYFISSLSLLSFLNMNVPAALLQSSICPTCKIQDNLISGFLIISAKSFLSSKVKFTSSLEHEHHWWTTIQSTQSTSAIPHDKFMWAIAASSSITGTWSNHPGQHGWGKRHLGIHSFPSRRSLGPLYHSSNGKDNF